MQLSTGGRVNWIDWAKASAAVAVVFCHLPQSQEWFYYRYLQSVVIVVFFFLSGYLKRDRGSTRANWQKYWRGLIQPYIIYNAIVYPCWLAKFVVQHGDMPDLLQSLRPVFGALLFQHESELCTPLNGPLWYLPVILAMHVTIDLCRKSRYGHALMVGLCALSVVLYAANKYFYFAPQLTPMGLMRNLPYYYLGYVMGRQRLLDEARPRRDWVIAVVSLLLSVGCFACHLDAFRSGHHLLHIALFYPVNVAFLLAVVYGCRMLDGCRWHVVTRLSIGTLMVIGLHMPLVTLTNVTIGQWMTGGTVAATGYQWYEALPAALLIVALLYPVIAVCGRRFPYLLGR